MCISLKKIFNSVSFVMKDFIKIVLSVPRSLLFMPNEIPDSLVGPVSFTKKKLMTETNDIMLIDEAMSLSGPEKPVVYDHMRQYIRARQRRDRNKAQQIFDTYKVNGLDRTLFPNFLK